MNVLDYLKGGADRMRIPRTMGALSLILECTANAKTRSKDLETPEGEKHLERIIQLERNLTPRLWKGPSMDERLDSRAVEDATDLLYELNLLNWLTVSWVIRATGLRQRRKMEDLIPKVVSPSSIEAA